MSASLLEPMSIVARARASRALLAALAIGLAAMGAAFWPEARAAVHVWYASTAYSHCFFVLPIALYLGWDRRAAVAATPVEPFPVALLAGVPLALVWLAAERLGLMEGRQIMALAMFEVFCLAVLGWRMCRVLAAPLLYLFFLVPFGAFVTPALQQFTARFTTLGLDLIGVPNFSDAFTIMIPEGNFYVAEACAGLRFLIASIAFGTLYACLIYTSVWRRVAFIAASIVVPIIANGFRALGIVTLGHIIGSAQAAVTDHILYGWMFFSIVILLLILAGLPFRQDHAIAAPAPRRGMKPAPATRGTFNHAIAIAAGFVLIANGGPLAAMALDRAAIPAAAAVSPEFAVPDGCATEGSGPDEAAESDADGVRHVVQQIACGGVTLTVSVATLPPRANPSLLAATLRGETREGAAEDASIRSLPTPAIVPASWRLAETSDPSRMTATALWLDGVPSSVGLRARVDQAARGILGAGSSPVLVAVGLALPGEHIDDRRREQSEAVLARFLNAQSTLDAQVRARSAIASR
jgi:exosortase A